MTDLFGPVCPCCGQPAPEQARTPFAEFWDIWPDKRAKEPARKGWDKLTPQEQAMAKDRAAAWFRKWRKEYPTASPIMAATYLNQQRFLDDGVAGQGASLDDTMATLRRGLEHSSYVVQDHSRRMLDKLEQGGLKL